MKDRKKFFIMIVAELTVLMLLLVAVILIMLKDSDKKETDEEEVSVTVQQTVNKPEEKPAYAEYEWTAEPFLEADAVTPPLMCSGNSYAVSDKFVYIVKDGDKTLYGSAGLDGSIYAEPSEQVLFVCEKNPGELISEKAEHGISSHVLRQDDSSEDLYYFNENEIIKKEDKAFCAVKDEIKLSEDNKCDISKTTGYGLWYGGKITVPAEYDACILPSCGAAALKKEDLWTFYNSAGEKIFENIEPANTDYASGFSKIFPYFSNGVSTLPDTFTFSSGLIPIKNADGMWAYFDASGKQITGYDFEGAAPVYNGMAFAEKDGLWGIITFPSMKAAYDEYNKITDKLCAENKDKVSWEYVYITGDSVPELFVRYKAVKEKYDLYTFDGTKAVLLLSEETASPEFNFDYKYKSGCFSVERKTELYLSLHCFTVSAENKAVCDRTFRMDTAYKGAGYSFKEYNGMFKGAYNKALKYTAFQNEELFTEKMNSVKPSYSDNYDKGEEITVTAADNKQGN